MLEPTGSEPHVVVRLAGQEIVAVFRDRQVLRPGDTIHLTPNGNPVHLFDAASGERIN